MKTLKEQWQEYLGTELPKIAAFLKPHSIILDTDQPHVKGERYLMQALTTVGGKKLILLGKRVSDGLSIVIKASAEESGKAELKHERNCRTLLHSLHFSYDTFHSPAEVLFIEKAGYTIFVSEFIAQSESFLHRPIEAQFTFSLAALKAQERTRATTYGHLNQIKKVFGSRSSSQYLTQTERFINDCKQQCAPAATLTLLEKTLLHLTDKKGRIEQYGNFLTHTDFVPHNFRIKDDTLYLLDFSSLRFGNKHESWARFLNFMTLYNPALEGLLLEYVTKNRAPEERESLQLMRLYRLAELITYYVTTLEKSDGALLALNHTRIKYWSDVLQAELQNHRVDPAITAHYQAARDHLRSDDEKERQVNLH